MLTGIFAELLVVQSLVIAELAQGSSVTVILVLAQRRCELTSDRVLLDRVSRFHLPLGLL